jgi:hypothetical protein
MLGVGYVVGSIWIEFHLPESDDDAEDLSEEPETHPTQENPTYGLAQASDDDLISS